MKYLFRTSSRLTLLVLALALVAAACGSTDDGGDSTTTVTDPATTTTAGSSGSSTTTTKGPAPAPDDPRGTTLVTQHPQEPPSWNYWENGSSAIMVPVFINIVQPLVEVLGDGSIGPMLAESWEISDDGLEYVFTIREAKFHDGTTLEAADVVYSLNKSAESPLGKIAVPFDPVANVEAVDDRTVKLTLSAPSAKMLTELGKLPGMIVPEGSHEALDMSKELIGTGPYTFGEYRPDIDLTLHRFDVYWDELPYFETVVQRFIPNETAALDALLTGEVDLVGAVFGEGLDRVDLIGDRDGFDAHIPSPIEVNWVYLNTNREELRDERVRQAIAHGLDRDALLLAGQSGFGITTCTLVIPYSAPWTTGYCPYPYDPDRAIALLADAGVENLTLDFPYLTIAEFPNLKEVLVQQMAAIGITLEPRPQDLATWLEQTWGDASGYEYGSITGGAIAEAFACGGGRQPLGKDNAVVCDDTFNDLIPLSDSIVDPDAYVDGMTAMVNAFADGAWVIPTYSKSTPGLSRSDLAGVKPYRTVLEMDLRNLQWAG
jgi:peptide/nickel transport system substrate-binding protein